MDIIMRLKNNDEQKAGGKDLEDTRPQSKNVRTEEWGGERERDTSLNCLFFMAYTVHNFECILFL
jgi:hypothetical protein